MKSPIFNGLWIALAIAAAYQEIKELPDFRPAPPAVVALSYRTVDLGPVEWPLQLAGAWELRAPDRRFEGISALIMDGGRFLAVSDRGSVMRFDPPSVPNPRIWLADLRDGPGPWGEKWARDAESLARDPHGRGWWVGYEQNHSLWYYDGAFTGSSGNVDLGRSNWRDNRGAEGLLVKDGRLLVLAENGEDALRIDPHGPTPLKLYSDAAVADAARAPDGSAWVLLREKGLGGIVQSIGRLEPAHDGYLVRRLWSVPKGAVDNFEGMAIVARADGRWRFWLITDDGHRIMARTLLVALDLDAPNKNNKSPARRAGLSTKPSAKSR